MKQHHFRHVLRQNTYVGFQTGQKAMIQNELTKEWTIPGTVFHKVASKSFQVQISNGKVL